MKKLFLALILFTIGLTLAACTNVDTQAVEFASDNQVFALEAISASSLLDLSMLEGVSMTLAKTTTETDSTVEEEPAVADQITEIDQYIEMMERFLGNDELLSVNASASDMEGYDFMITYTTIDLLGNPKVYTLYYNEVVYETTDDVVDDTTTTTTTTTEEQTTTTEEETTATTDSTPVAQELEREREFFFEDSTDDSLVTYYITGILVDGTLEYNVEGKLVTLETGTIFRLRSFIDKDNFVKVEYKLEDDGQEEKFFYEVVQEGSIVSKSKVKIEQDGDDLKIRLEIVEGETSLTLQFNQEVEEDVTIIKIQYTLEDSAGVIDSGHIKIYKSIDPETNEVIYDYKVLSGQKKNTYEYQTRSHVYGGNESDTTDDASL